MHLLNRPTYFLQRISLLAVAALTSAVIPTAAEAQTVIYDGSQQLNFFSASRLTDDLMLTNNPADPTRNGIVDSGADPNVLEQGDAAWFRSTGRRMRNTNVGLASTATGADGDFMSVVSVPSDLTVADLRGAGAGYVLYDAKATTGNQVLNFSMFYNDPTPNGSEGENNTTGGNVAVRVRGVQETGVEGDPWDIDDFTYLASTGGAAAWISAGQHRDQSGEEAGPIVDNLGSADSSFSQAPDMDLFPSTDWQDISLPFNAGTGYDYLIFSFGAVVQDDVIGPDRFAFDNISFEEAAGLSGDYNGDGTVDAADYTLWRDNLGATEDGSILNGNGNGGVVDTTDYALWKSSFGSPGSGNGSSAAVPEPSAVLLGLAGAVGLVARFRRRTAA